MTVTIRIRAGRLSSALHQAIDASQRKVGQWLCGFWGGHSDMLHVRPGVLRLECCNCGRKTPGVIVY